MVGQVANQAGKLPWVPQTVGCHTWTWERSLGQETGAVAVLALGPLPCLVGGRCDAYRGQGGACLVGSKTTPAACPAATSRALNHPRTPRASSAASQRLEQLQGAQALAAAALAAGGHARQRGVHGRAHGAGVGHLGEL